MDDVAEVKVYRYSYWDEDTRTLRESSVYATLDMIRCGLGQPLFKTVIVVPAHRLKDHIYVPAEAGVTR